MLEHDETMGLIKLSHEGDESATTKLIQENIPLLKSIIKRYIGKGIEYDDLMQIGCIGLLKAIKNFSIEFNVRFSTYAVPMILGEVKRFMRDDGYIKVSRSIKTLAIKILQFVEQKRRSTGVEPTIEQIAANFQIDASEVVFAMDSNRIPLSIYERTDENDEKSLSLLDKISSGNTNEELVNRVALTTILKELSSREKKIIILRYFRDKTQSEIANELGVSQVQVSRLENKIIEKIRKEFLE